MNHDEANFHNLNGPPGILYVEEVAAKTRHSLVELACLAKVGILRPLGYPLPQNAKRLYARISIDNYLNDVAAMEKGRKALIRFWRNKNSSRLEGDGMS
jgi:hypothetical protein